MKKSALLLLSLFMMYGCSSTKKLVAPVAESVPIETMIDISDVSDDQASVVIDPGRITQAVIIYHIPKVVQGTYAISDFGGYIEDFEATNAEGVLLPVKQLDKNSWEISNATDLDKISYKVNDTFDVEAEHGGSPFSPSGTNIEPDNAILNLHGFIGYFDVLKNNQYNLTVSSPKEWALTSALSSVSTTASADGKSIINKFFAPRYFDITDNPMMYGNLDVEEFLVGDIKIVLSVYSPNGTHKASTIKETINTMMEAQKTYMGDINSTPRYDIYLYLAANGEGAPQGFGALEHHTSTVVVLPEAIPADALASAMIDVVSHEFFHIITPLSVHSEDVHYFDYNNPTFSKHLWMYEGVTEYFASVFQVDQGLVTEEEFYSKMLGKINSSLNYDDSMSFTVMSENILDEPYQSNYINVYQKGALIGMCVDILMREESDGYRGILQLMKELSQKYGISKPFEDDNLIAEISAMTYPSVASFLKTHVEGTTPIDYSDMFNKVGLEMKETRIETSYIQNGQSLIIGVDPAEGKIFFNEGVKKNSFWADNGVEPGDVITEVNGEALTMANANAVLGGSFSWKEGDDIKLTLKRGETEVKIDTKLAQSYTDGTSLVENENATDAQVAVRNAWLKG